MASILKDNRTPDRHWNGLIATYLTTQTTRLEEVFTAVDADADGFISEAELGAAMELTSDQPPQLDQVWQQTIAERTPNPPNPFHRNFKRDTSADDPSKIDFDEFYNTYVDQAYLAMGVDDGGSGGISLGDFFGGLFGK